MDKKARNSIAWRKLMCSETSKNQHVISSDISQYIISWVQQIPRHIWQIFFVVFVVNIFSYVYLFTEPIYTNHIFPEAFSPFGYPSYISLEGRWVQDIIMTLIGGVGIPLLHIIIGVSLQICNGIIFAKVLGLKDVGSLFIAAVLVSIHPFVIDYYSFGAGHITFVVGDFFVLIAFLINKRSLKGLFLGSLFIHFGIACYQPRIALIATLFILVTLGKLFLWDGSRSIMKESSKEVFNNLLILFMGALSYFLVLKIIQASGVIPGGEHFSRRLYINNFAEMIRAVPTILVDLRNRLLFENILNSYSQPLPGICLCLFIFIGILHLKSLPAKSGVKFLVIAGLIGAIFICMPVALYSTFLITKKAYWNSSRFYIPHVYVLAFLILFSLRLAKSNRVKNVVLLCAFLLAYNFILTNARTTQMAYYRTIHEFQFVNRIVSRIEKKVAKRRDDVIYKLVVVGDLPQVTPLVRERGRNKWFGKKISNATGVWANIEARGFIAYRQVELINFISGMRVVQYPSRTDVEKAKKYAESHAVWPMEESVHVLADDILVVVLRKPGGAVPTTMMVN